MIGYDYGICSVCGLPMVADDDGDIDLHTGPDGVEDIHAECCAECNGGES
jgi:hypothetical protein